MVIQDLDQHLEAIALGEPQAFGSWLAGAEPILRRQLACFARSVDTEAVLQEALLRVWQLAPRLTADGRPNGLLRLASRVARNLAISETRRLGTRLRSTEGPPEDELAALEAHSRAIDPLLRDAIQDCRSHLPAQPARALKARLELAGARSDRELANEIGMRLNTFLQNITRARRALVDCLKRAGIDLEFELS
jgi:DNA-directed RNA polymerase specialized sigma24 family protein